MRFIFSCCCFRCWKWKTQSCGSFCVWFSLSRVFGFLRLMGKIWYSELNLVYLFMYYYSFRIWETGQSIKYWTKFYAYLFLFLLFHHLFIFYYHFWCSEGELDLARFIISDPTKWFHLRWMTGKVSENSHYFIFMGKYSNETAIYANFFIHWIVCSSRMNLA